MSSFYNLKLLTAGDRAVGKTTLLMSYAFRYCPHQRYIIPAVFVDWAGDPQVISQLAMRDLSPITYRQGLECARDIGAVKYMECSSLTDKGVQEVFMEGARAAWRVREETASQKSSGFIYYT